MCTVTTFIKLCTCGDKIPEEKKAAITSALERLKEVHKAQNLDEIDSATEQLNQAWSAASEDLYRAQQAEAAAGDPAAAGEPAPDSDGVQDADFEVVDEGEAS